MFSYSGFFVYIFMSLSNYYRIIILFSSTTVLRMELDIQKFMQNHHLHEFEFQHFPTSYLRCAAHRVAQHYGLETTVADSLVDGSNSRIVARKTPESKYPAIALSEVPVKQARNDIEAAEKLKFVICQRPKASHNGAYGAGTNNGAAKTVEERIDDYNKARARIFNGSIPADVVGPSDFGALSIARNEPVNVEPSVDENKGCTFNSRSRVAVFKDAEKDRSDPDYDRNYKRLACAPIKFCCHHGVLMLRLQTINVFTSAGMLGPPCLTTV